MAKKSGHSHLIALFFHHVSFGRIAANSNKEAESALVQIVEALRKIRDGCDPDSALQIERPTGRPPARYSFPLAYQIDQWREQGQKWNVIEVLANEWLEEKGYRTTLTQARLMNLHKEQKPKIDAHRQAVDQITRINNQ